MVVAGDVGAGGGEVSMSAWSPLWWCVGAADWVDAVLVIAVRGVSSNGSTEISAK